MYHDNLLITYTVYSVHTFQWGNKGTSQRGGKNQPTQHCRLFCQGSGRDRVLFSNFAQPRFTHNENELKNQDQSI